MTKFQAGDRVQLMTYPLGASCPIIIIRSVETKGGYETYRDRDGGSHLAEFVDEKGQLVLPRAAFPALGEDE